MQMLTSQNLVCITCILTAVHAPYDTQTYGATWKLAVPENVRLKKWGAVLQAVVLSPRHRTLLSSSTFVI
jgi:hypothetical protein